MVLNTIRPTKTIYRYIIIFIKYYFTDVKKKIFPIKASWRHFSIKVFLQKYEQGLEDTGMNIEILHIPDLMWKLYIVYLWYMSYFPYDWQNDIWCSKSNGKDNEFEYNVFIICRYLNFLKKSDDHFRANRKFTSCYNIKIFNRLWEKYICYFHWTLHERGNNSSKMYDQSQKCANGLIHSETSSVL